MRQFAPTTGRTAFAKSRNNLFGARLSWTPGQRFYTLEAEAQPNVQTATNLRLYPQAASGDAWLASTAPQFTAVVQSRSRQTILPGVQDSVVTIELRSGTTTTGTLITTVVLSRSHGLLAGPTWLGGAAVGTPATAPLLVAVPASLGQSLYAPLALFSMQPGDELGYYTEPFSFGPITCGDSYALRRILTRQQRSDSLIIRYMQQRRRRNSGAPNCGSQAGTVLDPVQTRRVAISLLTGQSPQYPALALLTSEYRALSNAGNQPPLLIGLPITSNGSPACSGGVQLAFTKLYSNPGSGPVLTYSRGLDALGGIEIFSAAPGLGEVFSYDTQLTYYRRSIGSPLTCGSATDFGGLLPTRAAQAAAIATLYPNPAAEAATLTLASPARPGYALHLTDALGRTVWRAPVAAGQTSVAVPLAGQPGGLYLLHLLGAEGPATWRLHHE